MHLHSVLHTAYIFIFPRGNRSAVGFALRTGASPLFNYIYIEDRIDVDELGSTGALDISAICVTMATGLILERPTDALQSLF